MPTSLYSDARSVSLWSLTWGQLLCLLLFRLPRIVPRLLLRYTTATEKPYPEVIRLPSRDPERTIYCWIFLPPESCVAAADRRLPIHLDFHGGGFVMGQLAEQAPFCSLLSRKLGSVVLTVDYRMGPISKYPAAIHDSEDVARACIDESWSGYTALRHYIDRSMHARGSGAVDLDHTRLSISGFSSGGNLALNLLVSPPDWPSPLHESKHPYNIPALLFYPSLDSRQLPHERPLPRGMKRSSGWMRWIGQTMAHSYLEAWQSGEIRASPGLAALGSDRSRHRAVEQLVDIESAESQQQRRAKLEDETVVRIGNRQASQGANPDGKSGAVEPDSNMLHDRSHSLLVLPSQDTLAHQSNVWLSSLEKAGRLAVSEQEEVDGLTSRTLGVTPVRVPSAPHGWTQFPDFALSEEQRRQKYDIFSQCIDFVIRVWANGSAQ